MNMKMVANVLGMMILHKKMEENATKAATLIGMSNARNYIRNHADFIDSGSAFSEADHKRVSAMVKELEVRI